MRTLLLFLFFCLGIVGYGQSFPVKNIPSDMLQDAGSVVRKYRIECIQSSPTSGKSTYETVTTILKRGHVNAAAITISCDRYNVLKNFSGEVYDANGKLMYKIKKSDLIATEYSESFASDEKTYLYQALAANIPYTVKYSWEIENRMGILLFPRFLPITVVNQSLEEASYRIIQPKENLNFKCLNIPAEPERRGGKEFSIEWKLSKLKPLKKEIFSDYLNNLPFILAAPITFECDGTFGDMTNWKTFGDWHAALSEKRDVLSDDVKKKIQEVVVGKTNDREKVEALYDYLARSTRYVSMQLGLGGWRPIAANEVARTGFGDCKGLSNYMKAMLKEVGIESYCAAINTNRKDMFHEMASLGQANHMILNVPLKEEELWLECTNAELPFGYVHESIAGHQAFIIEKGNSRLTRLPSEQDSLNSDCFTAIVVIDDEGKAIVKVTKRSRLSYYEALIPLMKKNTQEKIDFFRKEIRLSEGRVTELTVNNHKSSVPEYTIDYTLESGNYASSSGARLYVPITVFRGKEYDINESKQRESPIVIENGFTYNDTIRINIPNNYEIETIPKNVDFKCELGYFKNTITKNDGYILIHQSFQVNSGHYPASKNETLFSLYNIANHCCHDKIILRKK